MIVILYILYIFCINFHGAPIPQESLQETPMWLVLQAHAMQLHGDADVWPAQNVGNDVFHPKPWCFCDTTLLWDQKNTCFRHCSGFRRRTLESNLKGLSGILWLWHLGSQVGCQFLWNHFLVSSKQVLDIKHLHRCLHHFSMWLHYFINTNQHSNWDSKPRGPNPD